MALINQQLDIVSSKMEDRNTQIKQKQSEKEELENQNFIYMKKIDELNANLKNFKKK